MIKGKSFVAFAVAALAVVPAAKSAFAETLLDQFEVKSVSIAQVTDAGACLMFVTVPTGAAGADEVRVVGDASGEVKLYSSVQLANNAAATANLNTAATITLKRKEKVVALSTPSKELISLHKAIVKEKAKFTASRAALETERALGQQGGWDVALLGSVKRDAYDLMVEKLASQAETLANATAKETQYATQLTGAGISPVTYLPIV